MRSTVDNSVIELETELRNRMQMSSDDINRIFEILDDCGWQARAD